MSRFGQLVLGAAVAICISGAAVRADVAGAWSGRQVEMARWQQAQRTVDAQLDVLGTEAIKGIESFVRALVKNAD